ncbi:hypothetical protein B0H10DRAFT_1953972 [Mycena sp. CBHHK59/15]|nr:hypothetical protein B0H10DRAFT_1953972 [Mycena sp. CBHHK59/15]
MAIVVGTMRYRTRLRRMSQTLQRMYYVLDIVLGAIPDASKAAAGKRRGGKIISTHLARPTRRQTRVRGRQKVQTQGRPRRKRSLLAKIQGKSKAEAQDNNTFKALGVVVPDGVLLFPLFGIGLQLVSYSAFHSQNVNKGRKSGQGIRRKPKRSMFETPPQEITRQDGTKTKTHPDTVWKSPRSAGSGTRTQIVPKNLLLTTRSSATSIQRDGEGKGMDGIALNDVLVTEV